MDAMGKFVEIRPLNRWDKPTYDHDRESITNPAGHPTVDDSEIRLTS